MDVSDEKMNHVHGYGSFIWLLQSPFKFVCILVCIVVINLVLPIANTFKVANEIMYENWTIDLNNMFDEMMEGKMSIVGLRILA